MQAAQWRLSIDGHHRFVFGEPRLEGYVQIPWEVTIDFTVDGDSFSAGVGNARWLDKVTTGSAPQDWVECHLIAGSFLDADLHLRQLPRVRLARFPVAGAVEGAKLVIKPGYVQPGNYLAIQYSCSSDNPAANEWFLFAQRARNELGKRQDAETREAGDHRSAVVREVKPLPPEGELNLPLLDGWFFQQGTPDADYYARYRLQRLSP